MPIETAEDLEIFFDPDDFGTEVTAVSGGQTVIFNAIFTDSNEQPSPGVANISVTTPRIICRRDEVSDLKKDTPVTVNGKQYLTKNKELRGALATIYLKEA